LSVSDRDEQLLPGQARHPDVADDQIGAQCERLHQPVVAVYGGRYAILRRKRSGDHSPQVGIVVDHQDQCPVLRARIGRRLYFTRHAST
jgi:hypothetical protein